MVSELNKKSLNEIKSYYYKEFEKENKRSKKFIEKLYQKLTIIKLKPGKKEEEKLKQLIKILNLKATPTQVLSSSLSIIMSGLILSGLLFLITNSILLTILGIVITFFSYKYVYDYPKNKVNSRRLNASTELMMGVLYLVINMRHTPNIERAVKLVSESLKGVLGNDFKKIIWDVESKKYSTVQEALQEYLNYWKETNPEFVDSVYLIINSTYQVSENKRVELLDKALNRVLEGSLETMTHYANALKNPIQGIYMLGITLPIFGLITLPIVAAFLSDLITESSIFIFYNLLLPLGVIFLIIKTLSKRPIAFEHPNIDEHPLTPPKGKFWLNYKNKKLTISSWIPAIIVFFIGLTPFGIYEITKTTTIPVEADVYFSLIPIIFLGLSISLYTYLNTFQKLKIRKNIELLENQFSDTTFQLGSKISEGIPLEQAFLKIGEISKGTQSANFFNKVISNMQNLGFSLKQSIFDNKEGALIYYPSNLVKATMKILIQGSEKSLEIASNSMMNVSEYLRNIHKINEKIKDILSETLSSLNFQASFIAPLISGVVVGLTSMIMTILATLGTELSKLDATSANSGSGSLDLSGFWSSGFFNVTNAIPLTTFQLIIGLYFIQVVVLMMVLASMVENAKDPLIQQRKVGNTMLIAICVYAFTTFGVTIIFGGLVRFALSV